MEWNGEISDRELLEVLHSSEMELEKCEEAQDVDVYDDMWSDLLTDEDCENVLAQIEIESRPEKKPEDDKNKGGFDKTLSFLSSLSSDSPITSYHPSSLPYLSNFSRHREELASILYKLFNTEIFNSMLPEAMSISWNVRLTKTAGRCYLKWYRNRNNIEVKSCRIELSTKVIDYSDRLRDTLIHEMCHAATWIISGKKDGHGPIWRSWAQKAMQRFPELPVIRRCHSYEIRTKK